MILKCATPILESLGNATTIRNENSSRFGKFNTLIFNGMGSLVGGEIKTYLLESSRVTAFSKKERTYHIFYELFAGMSNEDLQEKYGLESKKRYKLMYHDHGNSTPSRGDDEKKEGLRIMRMGEAEIEVLFKILAAIVHLYEIQFESSGSGDGTRIKKSSNAHAAAATDLLGFGSVSALEQALCKKMIIMPRSGILQSDRKPEQAQATLHALCKMIYKRLFDYVGGRINEVLDQARRVGGPLESGGGSVAARARRSKIGILDIYGFECLQTNSFEQLSINLANEKLQEFFCVNVIGSEQKLYEREGLKPVDIKMADATPLLDAIYDTFTVLDDCGKLIAKSQKVSDEQFTKKAVEKNKKKLQKISYSQKKGGPQTRHLKPECSFSVHHYAGEVPYSTEGWLDKNNSRLSLECEKLLCLGCPEGITREIVANKDQMPSGETPMDGSGTPKILKYESVGSKYVVDLDSLMQQLLKGMCHYIRCYKPNQVQKPDCFEGASVLEQMRQSGALDLIKIMHEGFPHRCPFNYLVERYQGELKEFADEDPRFFIEALMFAFKMPAEDWCLGRSRVFLKSGKLAVLDQLTSESGGLSQEVISSLRRFIAKKKFHRCLSAIKICNYLPKFLRNVRREKLLKNVVTAARNLVRISRWVKRVRARLRAIRLEKFRNKLHSTVRLGLALKRNWLDPVRRKLALVRNMEIAFVHFPKIGKFLRLYIAEKRIVIQKRLKRRNELFKVLCDRVVLQRALTRLTRKRRARLEMQRLDAERRARIEEERRRQEVEKLERELFLKEEARRIEEKRVRMEFLNNSFYRCALLSVKLKNYQRSLLETTHMKQIRIDKLLLRFRAGVRIAMMVRRKVLRQRAEAALLLERSMHRHKLLKHWVAMTLLVRPMRRYCRRLRQKIRKKRRQSLTLENNARDENESPERKHETNPAAALPADVLTQEHFMILMQELRGMKETVQRNEQVTAQLARENQQLVQINQQLLKNGPLNNNPRDSLGPESASFLNRLSEVHNCDDGVAMISEGIPMSSEGLLVNHSTSTSSHMNNLELVNHRTRAAGLLNESANSGILNSDAQPSSLNDISSLHDISSLNASSFPPIEVITGGATDDNDDIVATKEHHHACEGDFGVRGASLEDEDNRAPNSTKTPSQSFEIRVAPAESIPSSAPTPLEAAARLETLEATLSTAKKKLPKEEEQTPLPKSRNSRTSSNGTPIVRLSQSCHSQQNGGESGSQKRRGRENSFKEAANTVGRKNVDVISDAHGRQFVPILLNGASEEEIRQAYDVTSDSRRSSESSSCCGRGTSDKNNKKFQQRMPHAFLAMSSSPSQTPFSTTTEKSEVQMLPREFDHPLFNKPVSKEMISTRNSSERFLLDKKKKFAEPIKFGNVDDYEHLHPKKTSTQSRSEMPLVSSQSGGETTEGESLGSLYDVAKQTSEKSSSLNDNTKPSSSRLQLGDNMLENAHPTPKNRSTNKLGLLRPSPAVSTSSAVARPSPLNASFYQSCAGAQSVNDQTVFESVQESVPDSVVEESEVSHPQSSQYNNNNNGNNNNGKTPVKPGLRSVMGVYGNDYFGDDPRLEKMFKHKRSKVPEAAVTIQRDFQRDFKAPLQFRPKGSAASSSASSVQQNSLRQSVCGARSSVCSQVDSQDIVKPTIVRHGHSLNRGGGPDNSNTNKYSYNPGARGGNDSTNSGAPLSSRSSNIGNNDNSSRRERTRDARRLHGSRENASSDYHGSPSLSTQQLSPTGDDNRPQQRARRTRRRDSLPGVLRGLVNLVAPGGESPQLVDRNNQR